VRSLLKPYGDTLNSFFNPLIYAVRIRYFRVAFIQLFSRRTLAQAEELEKRIFESRRIGVEGTAKQNRASGKFEGATLGNGQTTQYSGRARLQGDNIEETVV